jgi:hypothetical protein
MVPDVNPFQYVLTRHIVGGKYNKWIVILPEFDLDFASDKVQEITSLHGVNIRFSTIR